MAAAEPDAASSFTFTPLSDDKAFPSLKTTEARDALSKWNLDPFMQAKTFRFDHHFSAEQADAFLHDFFGSSAVQAAAPVCVGTGGKWGQLGAVSTGAVKHARLPTTVLRMDFFARLDEAGVVRAGDISKCFDVQCGDVLVSDRLRKLLLDESDEDWDLFSAAERNELIFHLMRRLAVGGGMNQWDDAFAPYLALTKALYKDFVSVSKVAGKLQISSQTYQVTSIDGSSAALFPRPGPHNFCYVTVDPLARHVKLWYAAWFPMM